MLSQEETVSPVYRLPSQQGPVARLLSSLLVIAVLVLAFSLGVFVFLIVFGLAVVAGIVLYLRIWWMRRQWARQRPPGSTSGGGVTLEGEYTVDKRDEKFPGR